MPGTIRNSANSIGEAVVNPVKDEVGLALEQGVSSIMGTNLKPTDPKEEAKKKADDQKKRQNILRFLNQFNTDKQRYEVLKQQEEQRKQAEEQQKTQEKMKIKQLQIVKKQKVEAITQAQTRMEAKKGIGG